MTIAIVFDISERVEDFLRTKPPLKAIIFDYYVNFFYFFSNLFSFLIIFIAVIFFTSKLAQNSEVIAILSSGVSFPRFLRPYFVAATILTSVSLYANHFLLPKANKTLMEFEARYMWNKNTFTRVHREMDKNLTAFISSYYEGKVDQMWMEKWNGDRLESVFYASRAYVDSLSKKWRFEDYFQRKIYKDHEEIRSGAKLDTTLTFTINDFGLRSEWASTMNSFELRDYVKKERERGNEEIIAYESELHKRTANPMATYILTIIAVCVSCRKTRGGTGAHIMIGLLVAMLYIFMIKIFDTAATNAGMSPLVAAWIPNIVFSIVAIFFYRWARR